MKRLQKFALVSGLAVATLAQLSSCKIGGGKNTKSERAKKEACIASRRVRDSVLKAMEYDGGVEVRLINAESELKHMTNLTQKDILRANVDKIISKYAQGCAKDIMNLLNKYGLHVKDVFGCQSEYDLLVDMVRDGYFIYAGDRTFAKTSGNEQEKQEILKTHLPYGMFNDFDWRGYGPARQKEIKNSVYKIFEGMTKNIDNDLRVEVKKFAAYYPILDVNKSGVPAKYMELFKDYDPIDFNSETDMFDFEYADNKMSVTRVINLYEPNISDDFFVGHDATYKLVNVSDHKWQIIRTDKNGQITKTPVFSNDAEYQYETNDYNIGCYPMPDGKTGVHITAREKVWGIESKLDSRCKDLNGKMLIKRDSLIKEVVHLEKLNKRMKKIRNTADSIAKIRQQEYLVKTK